MRISINRTDLTVLALVLVTLIALAFAPGTALGQDGNTSAQPQNVPSAIEGIVTKRTADTFTVRSAGGTETVVVLTDTTTDGPQRVASSFTIPPAQRTKL